MISGKYLFRICILLLIILFGVTTASAWSLNNWAATVQTQPAVPGTPVTVHYNISFSSYMTGTTFDSSDSLVMVTDLSSPQWTVTKTDIQDDDSTDTTALTSSKNRQVRLDGWSLSASRTQFNLNIELSGRVPALNQSQDITLVSLQERDAGAKTVSGTLVKKTLAITVPTPEPTAPPLSPTSADTTEPVILQQAAAAAPTSPAVITPTRKQTYSPGPDPLMTCGILAGMLVLWARRAGRK